MSDNDSYRISELAEEFNISLRSLRFYEDRGLINPLRIGSTRVYSRADRDRLQLILHFKSLGFSLIEAKQIMEIYDQPTVKRRNLESVRTRLIEQQSFLQKQSAEIEKSLQFMEDTLAKVDEKIRRASGDAQKC